MENLTKSQLILLALLVSFVTSIATGIVTVTLVNQAPPQVTQMVGKVIEKTIEKVNPSNSDIASVIETIVVTEEELTVKAVDKIMPSVVSVVVAKDGSKISSGTGFIVSPLGMVATSKHVVAAKDADYSVILNNGDKIPAEVLARDDMQDIAILQIKQNAGEKMTFSYVSLGNSDNIKIGQKVIAIGNALGELQNTVSIGIISGLDREIIASGAGGEEHLFEVIQTDAPINFGNSGGPLLNLKGDIIGLNAAKASGAENIGFALPINAVKKIISDINEFGEIKYAFLGARYLTIDAEIAKEKGLNADYGVLLVSDKENNIDAVLKDSPADKAGLKDGDIILKFNGEKINGKKTLSLFISKARFGDKITLRVKRENEESDVQVTLGEKPKEL